MWLVDSLNLSLVSISNNVELISNPTVPIHEVCIHHYALNPSFPVAPEEEKD